MIQEKNEIVEYSISPNSGRIKKKIRYRKKRSLFSSRRMKKYMDYALMILLVIAFLISFVLIIKPGSEQRERMQMLDKKGVEK